MKTTVKASAIELSKKTIAGRSVHRERNRDQFGEDPILTAI
jgi:hypothetical protein